MMLYSVIVYAIFKLYLVFNIYQQAHYQLRFYFKHFTRNILLYDLFPLAVLWIGIRMDHWLVTLICSLYLFLYSLFYLIRRKPLMFTKRIARLCLLTILFVVGLCFIPYAGIFMVLLIEFCNIPILLFEQFLSKQLNRPYLKSAKNRMKDYSGNVIAITGSFGKTSSKMLFQQALSCFYSSAATMKSYNTPLGISKFINGTAIAAYDYLVLEFGASQKGDIQELEDIAKPKVAMITEIGYMHMETFGSLEAIICEKMSLAEHLDSDGVAILNYDCDAIRNYHFHHPVKKITYGFTHGDYTAKNIQIGPISSFDFYHLEDCIGTFKIRLVGKHQMLNLLGVLAYLYEQGEDMELLKRACMSFEVEKNRLELKKFHNRVILDDSFNSNYKGFVEALNILSAIEGFHILLTPGMVELGSFKKELMNGLVSSIVHSCHAVILIGYQQTKGLYQILKEYPIEVYVVRNFMEGYRLYLSIAQKKKYSALLIENDLPDLYRVGSFC